MKKISVGVALGFVLASAVYLPLLVQQREASYLSGVNSGRVAGLAEAAAAIERAFGLHDGASQYTELFSVKTTWVVAVDEDGVRTVRVIP